MLNIFPCHAFRLLSRPQAMLSELRIQNYALIEKVVLQFTKGFTVLTGETGAGKSIIMGALGLVLGDRADTTVLFNKQQKTVVEALFTNVLTTDIKQFLFENDFINDEADEILIRRELSPAGKSRAFINDIPAPLQQLRQLTAMMVNLHRQFDTLELVETGFQQKVLDAFAGNIQLLKDYTIHYDNWKESEQLYKRLATQKENILKESDYTHYLLEELMALGLQPDELENLSKESDLLSHAEEIKTGLQESIMLMQHSDTPVLPILKQIIQKISAAAHHYTTLEELVVRLQSCYLELQDIAAEISSNESNMDVDETRHSYINERLNEGYRLQKKHQVNTTAALLELQQSLQQKILQVENMDANLLAAEKDCTENYEAAFSIAILLEKNRLKAISSFERACSSLLKQVGMPHAALQISLVETPLQANGKNAIQMLFDANGNNRFESLEKVASGGELSRLMLCLKSMVAEKMDMPTLIFDEIDSGISGEAAQKTGIIMQQLAADRQVIAITHQPQIAGKAHTHLLIFKENINGALRTAIRTLENSERLETIARMVSGDRITTAALQHAEELLSQVKNKETKN